MTTSSPTAAAPPRAALAAGAWLLGALAFPVGGLAGGAVAGPVTSLAAGVAGGLVAGAVIGAGQSLAALGRLPRLGWTVATALGMAAGLGAGATAVGFATTLPALAAQGAITGAAVGLAQSLVLPRGSRAAWAALSTALLSLGWTVTTLIGVDVERHYAVFGSSGAVVVTTLSGAALALLLRPRAAGASR
ncbi:hypothetical protein [uncultured Amnibacterium sp.]|uniref:hypothetical protein n=1 Tax=uncultured Amnibacterium sp. TaxID=1631851 RepID=UPI0035C97EFF